MSEGDGTVTPSPAVWSMRAVLVSVSDLARSVPFYCDVLGLREVGREDKVVVLEGEHRRFAVALREVTGLGVHQGQEALGPRAITFEVGSLAELDVVAERLQEAGALVSRSPLHESEPFEVVKGHDPDRFPLLFVTYEAAGGDALHADHYRHVAAHMYGVDL